MDFWEFSIATLLGSGFWSLVLAWFGAKVIGDEPALLQNPEALIHVLKAKLAYFVVGMLVFGGLYFGVHWWMKRLATKKSV